LGLLMRPWLARIVLSLLVDSVADSVAVVLTRDCSNTESQKAV
jgi:hypothetical protein